MRNPITSTEFDGREWYGWQIMMADAASIGLFWYGLPLEFNFSQASSDPEYGIIAGFIGYLFAALILHLRHQQWWKSGASLGLRVGLPLIATFSVAALSEILHPNDIPAGLIIGATAIAAMVIDYYALAYRPMPEYDDA